MAGPSAATSRWKTRCRRAARNSRAVRALMLGEHEATTLAAGAAVGLEQDAEPGRVADLDVARGGGTGHRRRRRCGVESEARIRRRVDVDTTLDHDLLAAAESTTRIGTVLSACSVIWSPSCPRPCGPVHSCATPRAHESGGNDADYFAGVRSSTGDTCAGRSGGSVPTDATVCHPRANARHARISCDECVTIRWSGSAVEVVVRLADHVGAEPLELPLEPVVAAVDVVRAAHRGHAVRDETRDDERRTGADVAGLDRRTRQQRDAVRP